MHEHDIDIIMALAEGTLDASEISQAEAEIAGCDQCAEDFALQRLALATLGAAPRVYMTEMESTRMRRAVRGDLGLATAATAVTAATRRRFTWGGALGAAAVLIIVVAVAPTLNLLGGGGSDEASTETFAAAQATTTTAPASGAPQMTAEGSAADSGAAVGADEGPAEAPATTTVSASGESLQRFSSSVALGDLKTAYQDDFANPEFASPEFASGTTEEAATENSGGAEAEACVDTGIAALNDEGLTIESYDVVGLWDADGVEAMVIAYETDEGEVVVLAFDAVSCEIVARA